MVSNQHLEIPFPGLYKLQFERAKMCRSKTDQNELIIIYWTEN